MTDVRSLWQIFPVLSKEHTKEKDWYPIFAPHRTQLGIAISGTCRQSEYHQEYNILLNELKQYNPELLDKKRVMAISKSDCADKELMAEMECDLPDIPYVFISSVTGTGLTELKDILWKVLNE